jgi:hypothetical protein
MTRFMDFHEDLKRPASGSQHQIRRELRQSPIPAPCLLRPSAIKQLLVVKLQMICASSASSFRMTPTHDEIPQLLLQEER